MISTKMRITDNLDFCTMNALLNECSDIEEARRTLVLYLDRCEWSYRSGEIDLHLLERATTLEAIKVFKNLISPRNEKLAGMSTLELLWKLARGEDVEVSEGFIEEINHLLTAINGKAHFSEGWLGPILKKEGIETTDFSKIQGRIAGIARSNYLDRVAEEVFKHLSRFKSGLDPEVIEKRNRNREKILLYFNAGLSDWHKSSWQHKHILKGRVGVRVLRDLVSLSKEEGESIELAVENNIPFGITPYYLSLFDFDSPQRVEDHQVRSQVIPPRHYVDRMIERRGDREYYFDFMGEHDTSPADMITRRYASIAILKVADTCAQICVYCQRNWEIDGPLVPGSISTKREIDNALDWFAKHPAIMDILITGGDSFVLSNNLITHIMDRLQKMDHIINIRWATRTIVTLPMRITDELALILGGYIEPGRRNVCVVTHVESGHEITPEVAEAVYRLRRQGLYVYNQQVYTVDTSRRFQTAATRIALKRVGIDPYYTFYPKGKEEHRDYRVPIARVLQERKEEARFLPGMFRTDEPVANVPRLGKSHLRAWQDRELLAIRPDGGRVYLFHPWEKGIAPVKPWVYGDTPIYDYLQEIERRGEDPTDYQSIWYYY